MAKHSTTKICKAAIPALIVSYSGSVPAGESSSDVNSINTDTSNTSSGQTPPANANRTPRPITVANANEQLNQYQGGKIDLNQVGFGQLQNIMDSFAQIHCAHAVQSSCRWKVLRLERTGRGKDGEQISGVSAVSFPNVAGNQKNDDLKAAKAIKIALHSLQSQSSQYKNDKPIRIPVTYQPQVIATTIEQRVTATEWTQSFSAPHPDDTAIVTTELATPVTIVLPRRSEVKLVVNGDEEAAETLDAGHKILDTKSLPEGSYPIEIHVKDNSNEQRIIHQMFGRHHLAVHQPTTSYGVFRQEPPDRRQAKAKTSRKSDAVLQTTVVTSLGPPSGNTINVSSSASRTADVKLVRRGNQYQLALDGAISSQSALGNALKAAYLGKHLKFSFQGIGFVPARELTGDPVLASFLGVSEHLSLAERIWYQGDFVFPLIPVRHQDPIHGLVESRTDFATRLAHVVGKHSPSNPSVDFRFIARRELGAIELKANFQTMPDPATPFRSVSASELEIETPFFDLA